MCAVRVRIHYVFDYLAQEIHVGLIIDGSTVRDTKNGRPLTFTLNLDCDKFNIGRFADDGECKVFFL